MASFDGLDAAVTNFPIKVPERRLKPPELVVNALGNAAHFDSGSCFVSVEAHFEYCPGDTSFEKNVR